MNWSEIVTIVASFIVSLGGGGAIVFGLSKWIGEILAGRYVERTKGEIQQEVERAKGEIQQEIESYKTKLQKSQFLFQKEFEAASQFISLYHRLIPSSQHPLDSPDERVKDFAPKLGDVEKELEQYRRIHGAALQQEVLKRLAETIEKAGSGKHTADDSQNEQPGILNYKDRLNLAEQVMEELEAIKNELWKKVWSQSST